MNVTHHRFSIGFNTFILVTTASSHDVTTVNVLMNSLVLACKWSAFYAFILHRLIGC